MTWLIKRDDAGTILSTQAVSLLSGIPIDHLDPAAPIPNDGLKSGRRRTREAAAHTGDNDVVSVMKYWANKELSLDVFDLGDQVILTEL